MNYSTAPVLRSQAHLLIPQAVSRLKPIKDPSFFLSHTDVENFYWTFFVHNYLMFNFGQI